MNLPPLELTEKADQMGSAGARACPVCIDSLTLELKVFNESATTNILVDDLKGKVWDYMPVRHLPNELTIADVTSGLRRSHGFVQFPGVNQHLSIESTRWESFSIYNSEISPRIDYLPGAGPYLTVGLEGPPENPDVVPYFLNDSRIAHCSCVFGGVLYVVPQHLLTRELRRFHISKRELLAPIRLPWEIEGVAVADNNIFIISGRGDFSVYILYDSPGTSDILANPSNDTAHRLCYVSSLPLDVRNLVVDGVSIGLLDSPRDEATSRPTFGLFGNQMSSILDERGLAQILELRDVTAAEEEVSPRRLLFTARFAGEIDADLCVHFVGSSFVRVFGGCPGQARFVPNTGGTTCVGLCRLHAVLLSFTEEGFATLLAKVLICSVVVGERPYNLVVTRDWEIFVNVQPSIIDFPELPRAENDDVIPITEEIRCIRLWAQHEFDRRRNKLT
ncbi:hypothetical protein Pmar_PMAR009055 [Perkinsus marinus ATCC 50983]|uniref:Uncharacterized protein n=1 Tax=Perkinsus marinus (strain ATCC 50983 / TXsc) TaxID=423536 RepID=C5LQ27_PERM5|nr:hypothetical protein Pmar_PMAR009055 [Perkinsus marinus ATCC 50983]EER01135.1 hypothetical protein Pmar_PMAR009055 [Perkinsus marinus ATCC 50983]|eukprot:XP_002768417.1 hypothetical protein Pmar_PMAR009055 [Perkinsus marinus ATCC 50983]